MFLTWRNLLIKKHKLGLLIAVATAIIFGLYPPSARAIYADGGNAAFVVLTTTMARGAALSLFCFATRRQLFATRHDVKMAAIGGFLQAVSILSIFGSLVFIPGPIMIIIVFTHTIMLLFFMAWKKEIELNLPIILTTLVALLGLSLALDTWHAAHFHLLGIGLAFIGALMALSRLYVYGQLTKTRIQLLLELRLLSSRVYLLSWLLVSGLRNCRPRLQVIFIPASLVYLKPLLHLVCSMALQCWDRFNGACWQN